MLTALLILGGLLNTHLPKLPDPVVVICRSSSLDDCSLYVQSEVGKYYPSSVVYLCHGDYDFRGVWTAYGDRDIYLFLPVQMRADALRKLYPKKKIIFWVCNEKGKEIKGKGIYYFKSKVWAFPDNQYPYTFYSEISHGWVTRHNNPPREIGRASCRERVCLVV